MDIEKAIGVAKAPKPLYCPECGKNMYSPMDKLSICMYGKCAMHHGENSAQEKNLFEIVKKIF